jgi:broad specificity phosphatase PhoE
MMGKVANETMLVVVRHGQTDWNLAERFQGHIDVPLNVSGCNQAKALRRRLEGIHFDATYSSPLRRALTTAQIINRDLPITLDARLMEIHHGCWQGRTKLYVARRWPDHWVRSNCEPERLTPDGGESVRHVRARVEDFISAVQGKNVLCVSHGVVIQTLLSILAGGTHMESNAYVPANGSMHTIRFHARDVYDYSVDRIA